MPTRLDEIVSATRRKVKDGRQAADSKELERLAQKHVPRGFRAALQKRAKIGPAIIAELKKASPSRGLIRANFDPPELARELEASGAAALSVLTDGPFFQGALQYLREASNAVKIPCLRKDFMVDESQIPEARAYGADAILLIVAALSQSELISLAKRAREFELDILCEIHDEEELTRALDVGFDIIGVNSRDLKTFDVDLAAAFRLAELIPSGVLRVAESGIHRGEDIARLRAAGYHAFLIGESLMKAEHPGKALGELSSDAQKSTAKSDPD